MNMKSLVSVQKLKLGYSFNHEDGDRHWSFEMSEAANTYLQHLTSMDSPIISTSAMSELQNLGFLKVSDKGEVIEPNELSVLGHSAAEVLKKLQFEPEGANMAFPAGRRAGLKPSPRAQRNIRMIGGFFLIVLAVAMFALGYNALLSLTSFLAKVAMHGGELADVATGMLVQSTGVLIQLLIVVVVPAVLLIYVGCLQVRAAIAQTK